MMDVDQINRVVVALGGWPQHLCDIGRKHGSSLMAVLIRQRVIDEVVFGIVVRYATNRAAYDDLSEKISQEAAEPIVSDKGFMSGLEQKRAYHHTRLIELERELLATPYTRMKSTGSQQADFLDILDKRDQVASGAGSHETVTPFRPLGGKRGSA